MIGYLFMIAFLLLASPLAIVMVIWYMAQFIALNIILGLGTSMAAIGIQKGDKKP